MAGPVAFYPLITTADQVSRARPRSERHASYNPGWTCRRCRWRGASRAACARDWLPAIVAGLLFTTQIATQAC